MKVWLSHLDYLARERVANGYTYPPVPAGAIEAARRFLQDVEDKLPAGVEMEVSQDRGDYATIFFHKGQAKGVVFVYSGNNQIRALGRSNRFAMTYEHWSDSPPPIESWLGRLVDLGEEAG